MTVEDRYCIDVVTQISAVRRVEEEVLNDDVSHCAQQAIAIPVSSVPWYVPNGVVAPA